MATKRTRRSPKSKKKSSIVSKFTDKLNSIVMSSQGLPIFLTITILGILVVLFRMTNVEMEYKVNNIDKKIANKMAIQKELNGKKARLLSVKNLHKLAAKYNLNAPKQSQIILIK